MTKPCDFGGRWINGLGWAHSFWHKSDWSIGTLTAAYQISFLPIETAQLLADDPFSSSIGGFQAQFAVVVLSDLPVWPS